MRLSCAHHRQKPHISQGYLATELHSLGGGRQGQQESQHSAGAPGPVALRPHTCQQNSAAGATSPLHRRETEALCPRSRGH